MKKLMVLLLGLMFILSSGCALWIHDRAHDDRRYKADKDEHYNNRADDVHGNKDGKGDHRDANNSDDQNGMHKGDRSNGDHNDPNQGYQGDNR